jgi:hypothetical protein
MAGIIAGMASSSNLAGLFGQASRGNLSKASLAKLERMAGRSGFGSTIAKQFLNKYQANQASANVAGAAPQAPSVVQTAGATNIGRRINTIESRLAALEGSGVSSNPAGDVAPPADMGVAAMPTDIPATPQMPAVEEPIIPQSEQLGSLMASPFTIRQRTNMGPLMFKDQTGDGKITRADVIQARIEGYKK